MQGVYLQENAFHLNLKMENLKTILDSFESDLAKLNEKYENEFISRTQHKIGMKGIQRKLSLISVLTENLTNEVMNLSIELVKKHKITDSKTINEIVKLNQKYIRKFNSNATV